MECRGRRGERRDSGRRCDAARCRRGRRSARPSVSRSNLPRRANVSRRRSVRWFPMTCPSSSVVRGASIAGSGSVPAFIAARLEAAQALGLVSLSFESSRRKADRRRTSARPRTSRAATGDGPRRPVGRRGQRSSASGAARPSAGRPRDRRSTSATSRSRWLRGASPVRTAPFRPRPRVLPAPSSALSARDRILSLSGALVDREPPRVVRLDPAAAADELLAQLQAWGYR